MLDPCQHHPVVLAALSEGEQQRAVVPRKIRFRGGWEDQVEPDYRRTAVENVAQHTTDLGGPQCLGRTAEGGTPIGLFIKSDNRDWRDVRSGSVEEPRTQQEQSVQRRTAQPIGGSGEQDQQRTDGGCRKRR